MTTGFADVKQPEEYIMSNWCNEMISIQISIHSTIVEVYSKWRSKKTHPLRGVALRPRDNSSFTPYFVGSVP